MWSLIHNIFGILVTYRYFDRKFAIVYQILVSLIWLIYKNECICSYYYKKNVDPEYKLGDNPYDTSDLTLFRNDITDLLLYRIFPGIIIPYFYYQITNDIKKTFTLLVLIFITFVKDKFYIDFLKSDYRYLIVFILGYLATDTNLIKDSKINFFMSKGTICVVLLLIYTHLFYDIEGINSMTLIGSTVCSYILYKYTKKN